MLTRLIALLILGLAACSTPSETTSSDTGQAGDVSGRSTGEICGGIAGFRCSGENSYCSYEPGICRSVADAAGVCKVKPQACSQRYQPVCGCDGETYSNACVAASAGVSVARQGVCSE